MKQTSYIELSKKALEKNIRYLKKLIGDKVKIVSVIKANAYGHGIQQFVPLAEKCGIDYFATFDVYEASKTFKVKKESTDLMVMGHIDYDNISWLINHDISFFVSNIKKLNKAILSAKKIEKPARIHIEVETGLHRTGIEKNNLKKVVQIIKKHESLLQLEGLCTHYAGAESISNYIRIHEQKNTFDEIKKWFNKNDINFRYCHTACSAAAIMYPETRMDMVRIGLAQYGYWPSKETKIHKLLSDNARYSKDPLKQILSWKSKVMDIKTVPPGEFIGYGHEYLADHITHIAIIPVGYFHGYRRSLSNVGHVLIHGKEAPIIGMVNMSMMITDISKIHNVQINDEVVLIGKQQKKMISVASFSERLNLVNYEFLTRLPMQIPRYVVK
jgi:alanine racemase